MRQDISIRIGAIDLAAWLYLPKRPRPPVVVMSHGFGAVKEMTLDRYAEVFCAAGLACLVYDHRNTGLSGGEPRGELDPWQQIHDMRDVVTFAAGRDDVDGRRIGLWGTSYSGGHVMVVGAVDRRVRCVVAQVPTISGYVATRRQVPGDQFDALLAELNADRAARLRGSLPACVPISLPGSESYAFSTVAAPGTPYRNEMTLRSRDLRMEYEPGYFIPRIAPTPFMMIATTADMVCLTDLQLAAFEHAAEPKRLVQFEGGHYVVYQERFQDAAAAAAAWFVEHL